MNKLLLNADLGEWENPDHRAELFSLIDLANVACGGHAGDTKTLAHCRDLAKTWNVKTGAHPGLPLDQGRRAIAMTSQEFHDLLKWQIEAFLNAGLILHHLKLHGALYHMTESNPILRERLLEMAADLQIPIICLAGGTVAAALKDAELPAIPEIFLDRNYLDNGQLVPRTDPCATLKSRKDLENRLSNWKRGNFLISHKGKRLHLRAVTACLHADGANAIAFAGYFRRFWD